jgi:hypothetical protein
MKALAGLLVISMGLVGCGHFFALGGVQGSGKAKTETRPIGDFHKIEFGGAIASEVKVGPKASLTITTDDNLLPLIESRVENGTLIIEQKGSTSTNLGTHVVITVPSLDSVEISGASKMTATGLAASKFEAQLSGASKFEATGHADELKIDASGASRVDLGSIAVKTAEVDASGASNIVLKASDKVTGNLSGASNLKVSGGAKVKVDTSGASNVSQS